MNANAYLAIAASIAVFTGIGAGMGISFATAKAAESIARQPEAAKQITSVTLLGTALAEATAVYGLVVALIMLLVTWGA